MASPRTKKQKQPEGPAPVVLFDTYSLLFRAHHALPPMNTATGEPTSALYGFSAVVLKVLKEQRPRAFAFALDAPRRTFRHEAYADYKGSREAAPSVLVEQLKRLPWLLEAFGVPVMCVPGFEADDVLATLATKLCARDEAALVVSGDRDMLQLCNERCRVYFVGARGQEPTLFDVEKVRERFGVEPAQMPTRAALVGDASDNLPGVPGIGPQTAAKLVQEFGSVEGLLARVDEVNPERIREALRAHAEQIRLNEDLSRLRRDVDLPEGELAKSLSADSFVSLGKAFEALEFKSLLTRLAALEGVLRATP
ncbi:MAG TPA: 5'-3' exonuclease H3TH domain-containing protein [Polyangiaceae bacterium]|nr:5'-3' exonuclease H3TH domain-containing protein [Polyangiaceae bacterium]